MAPPQTSYDCLLCGSYVCWKQQTPNAHTSVMQDQQICLTCASWLHMFTKPGLRVCEGSYAAFEEGGDLSAQPPGTKSRLWPLRFVTLEDGREHTSASMWPRGVVPTNLRSMYKPNIRIKRDEQ